MEKVNVSGMGRGTICLLPLFLIHNHSTPLYFFRHLLPCFPFYNPFPQPFYTLDIPAAELLVYCSQLLTVPEGNNDNDPLKQFLKSLAKISGFRSSLKRTIPKHGSIRPCTNLYFCSTGHKCSKRDPWFRLQQSLISVCSSRITICALLLIQCLHGSALYQTLQQFWKQNQWKTNLASTFFSSVAIFKPEIVTVLLWDTTKIKRWFRRK